jgi:hypothetical protein
MAGAAAPGCVARNASPSKPSNEEDHDMPDPTTGPRSFCCNSLLERTTVADEPDGSPDEPRARFNSPENWLICKACGEPIARASMTVEDPAEYERTLEQIDEAFESAGYGLPSHATVFHLPEQAAAIAQELADVKRQLIDERYSREQALWIEARRALECIDEALTETGHGLPGSPGLTTDVPKRVEEVLRRHPRGGPKPDDAPEEEPLAPFDSGPTAWVNETLTAEENEKIGVFVDHLGARGHISVEMACLIRAAADLARRPTSPGAVGLKPSHAAAILVDLDEATARIEAVKSLLDAGEELAGKGAEE